MGNFKPLALFDVKTGSVFHPDVPGCTWGSSQTPSLVISPHFFLVWYHATSGPVLRAWHQHMEKGSISSWWRRDRRWGPQQRGPPLCFMLSGAYLQLLIDNHWHLIWRRSNTQSIFVPQIRLTICCCPACRSLNLISFSRNKVLIVHLTCLGSGERRVMGFLVSGEGCRLEGGCSRDGWTIDLDCVNLFSLTEVVFHKGRWQRIAPWQ